MRRTMFAQQRLDVLDRHALIMQQHLDAAQEVHVSGPIIPSPACTLHRFDLGELAFPETQNMRLDPQPFRDFTNGAEGVR
jgi:hypothetical protein